MSSLRAGRTSVYFGFAGVASWTYVPFSPPFPTALASILVCNGDGGDIADLGANACAYVPSSSRYSYDTRQGAVVNVQYGDPQVVVATYGDNDSGYTYAYGPAPPVTLNWIAFGD